MSSTCVLDRCSRPVSMASRLPGVPKPFRSGLQTGAGRGAEIPWARVGLCAKNHQLGSHRFTPGVGVLVRSEPDGVAEDAVVGSPEAPSGSTDEDTPESSISPDGDSGERFLPSGNEAGTAPGDRGFRPDVEGLRGVA